MWCADCQQDVPAVVRAAGESLLCPRCQRELVHSASQGPNDAGLSLESYDQQREDELAPPIDWLAQEAADLRLREIQRKLSSGYRREPVQQSQVEVKPRWTDPQAVAKASPTRVSWLLTLMLTTGVMSLLGGLSVLAWSAAFDLGGVWQLGMSLTVGAEGLLILSLAWMAIRLWRNGRQLNQQLAGVDAQLGRVEQLAGDLAGSHLSSSHHFYHHFSQAASPHLLAANLRGQVEQLSARIGV